MELSPSLLDSITGTLKIPKTQVLGTVRLLEEGGTVPFIARYRKEQTGSLDEVQVAAVRDTLHTVRELEKRRTAIFESLEKQGSLTAELRSSLLNARTLTSLEDIYLPHRPKRRTRAMIAKEKGLEPLAAKLYNKKADKRSVDEIVNTLIPGLTREEIFAGAQDILAEKISEDPASRETLRQLFSEKGQVSSTVIPKQRDKAAKFRDYFDWSEPVSKLAGHRLLAMLRGERDKFLRLSVLPPKELALPVLFHRHIGSTTGDIPLLRRAIEDGYSRLIAPSLESELKTSLKQKADVEAIGVFSENLKDLLLAPPLGARRVLGIDPGFRTGAKIAALDEQGSLLAHETIYPTQSSARQESAAKIVKRMVAKYTIEAIGIGSGTAGRETEAFVRDLGLSPAPIITLVNEDGASVYSASEAGRREFPDLDLTIRGAISIGRRLQDPLAELVKLDPKAIGVGQYQHDVNQTMLQQGLDDVVESCVNSVGVELNSASTELLTHVSGLGPTLAANIVEYRKENGPFKDRKTLLKVARLGPKAYEQCSGFLRVAAGSNPLDRSAVHPERYAVVETMARQLGVCVEELMNSCELREKIRPEAYVDDKVGLPTITDILKELAKPGRDPRREFKQFSFASGIDSIEDLQEGMVLPAIITNVTTFGAFADIGVHQDGLIHISQLADRFVKNPAEVVSARQQVRVRVLEIDAERRRISLSLKGVDQAI